MSCLIIRGNKDDQFRKDFDSESSDEEISNGLSEFIQLFTEKKRMNKDSGS